MRALGAAITVVLLVLGAAQPVQAEDSPLPPPTVVRHGGAARTTAPRTPTPQAPRGVAPAPTAPRPAVPGVAMPRPPVPPPMGTPSFVAPRTPPQEPGYSQREIQQRIDAYMADDQPLFAPTAMPGIAGYDQGFRFRTAGFRLAINMILQARYEAFVFDGDGNDLSGFSLPRAILRLSGTAECAIAYLFELDFGHEGAEAALQQLGAPPATNLGPRGQANTFDILREAWVEWRPVNVINMRAGLIRTPNTRQLLTPAESQQFIDVSLGSAWTGLSMPGYTDRNRDYGIMMNGTYGPTEQFSYMIAVTNGDGGDDLRGVLDQRTSDNLAFSGRANYAFLEPMGYQEGALRQRTSRAYGEVGLWAYYYADRVDGPHTRVGDYLRYGIDLALGYGAWSFTGAYTRMDDDGLSVPGVGDSSAWLAQVGHHVVGSPFEVAARWSGYDAEGGMAQEFGLALNYYLNGHGNKLQLDATYLDTDAGAPIIFDPYAAYSGQLPSGDSAWLLRFQWQLGL